MDEKKYRQNPVIAWREIDNEAVLVDPRDGQIRVLNRTGSVVWDFCQEAMTKEDIAKCLVDKFEITKKEALCDVHDFIEDCLKRDLMQVV